MAFADLLNQTCTIQRYTSAEDDWGQPVKTWADYIEDEPCRVVEVESNDRYAEILQGAKVVLADFEVLLGPNDITERDQMILDSNTYEILRVHDMYEYTNAHHTKLYVRRVR
jgi:hypothetical protein